MGVARTFLTTAPDLALFLGLCLGALAAGVGGLRLVGFPRDLPATLWLAPLAITGFWTVSANVLVRAGLPMRQVAPPLWGVTLALALVGAATLWRAWRDRGTGDSGRAGRERALAAGAAAAGVALAAWPLFARGLTRHLGVSSFDSVNYTSIAALYWQYGLDFDPPMPPVDGEIAAALDPYARARNHAFVLLAFLSPLVRAGDPAAVRNLFVCWSLVVVAASVAFYDTGRAAADAPRGRSLAATIRLPVYLLVTMGLGWAVVPALAGNWDNLVSVQLAPALAGLALRAAARPGYAVVLGGLVAHGVYGYTELAPAVLLLVSPFFAVALARAAERRRLALTGAAAAAVAVALLAPALPVLWAYFWSQWSLPGGAVGFRLWLVEHATSPGAWWALGPEHGWPLTSAGGRLVAVLLTALALLGLGRAAPHRRAEPWALGLSLAGIAYLVAVERYSYGAYKVLSVSWWLWGAALVDGAAGVLALTERLPSGRRRRAVTAVAGAALAAVLAAALDQARAVRHAAFLGEATHRAQPSVVALQRLHDAARRQPPGNVLVSVDPHDGLTAPWINYAARSTALTLFRPDHLRIPMHGSRPWPRDDPPRLAGVLAPAARAWLYAGLPRHFETPEFSLVAPAGGIVLEDVTNPNGVEAWGMWLGIAPATLTVVADRDARAALTLDAVAGRSLGRSVPRTLVLRGEGRDLARGTLQRRGRLRLEFDARRGRNVLALAATDRPTRSLPHDPRARIVGIRALAVAPAAAAGDEPVRP